MNVYDRIVLLVVCKSFDELEPVIIDTRIINERSVHKLLAWSLFGLLESGFEQLLDKGLIIMILLEFLMGLNQAIKYLRVLWYSSLILLFVIA